jgi:hypothetical protein
MDLDTLIIRSLALDRIEGLVRCRCVPADQAIENLVQNAPDSTPPSLNDVGCGAVIGLAANVEREFIIVLGDRNSHRVSGSVKSVAGIQPSGGHV